MATWLYIDEFHVLLNPEYSAKYLQQLWKKVRKQGGLCTGITQNVVDLLQNYTATTMLANSEFVALLKQANTDSSKMAEVIGVSEAQLRFVTNTQSGMGLMKCGNVVIPFDNTIESPRTFKGACLKYYSVLFVTTDQRTDQHRSAGDITR